MKILRYIYCYFFIKHEQQVNEQIRKQRINRICVDNELIIINKNKIRYESIYNDNSKSNSIQA
jgi:hypothetical protein